MRSLTLVGMLVAVSVNLVAQQLKWEFGLFLGGANYQGDLVESYGPILEETHPAFGAFSRMYLSPEWALRLSFIKGTISGSDQNFSTSYFVETRNIHFSTQLSEISINLEWEPFGNRRFPVEGGYKRLLSPYFFGGAGYTFVQADPDYSGVPRTSILERVTIDKEKDKQFARVSVPLGGGLKLDLSKFTTLSLEAGIRASFTDYLDGVSLAGNPDGNDWYLFGGFTYSRKFGPPDYDHDGIADKDDACPRLAGVASALGCPDADGDGVEDLEDLCPTEFGPVAMNGCPDSDGDKVIDKEDACPFVAGLEALAGCPDTDADGIADQDDACPELAGVPEEKGCPYPDRDADGIIDVKDKCPDIAGVAEEEGCPYPDRDEDGVPDQDDACPDLAGPESLGGCPDTDGDLIPDPADRCPNSPGLAANQGCPEIDLQDQAILQLATKNVRFETGSPTLKKESMAILNQVVEVLKRYPDFALKISGHTDSRGEDEANLKLSFDRAQACFFYFADKGLNSGRFTFEGFGETRPIADNSTAEGRQLNRRVEFQLFPARPDSVLVVQKTDQEEENQTNPAPTEMVESPPPGDSVSSPLSDPSMEKDTLLQDTAPAGGKPEAVITSSGELSQSLSRSDTIQKDTLPMTTQLEPESIAQPDTQQLAKSLEISQDTVPVQAVKTDERPLAGGRVLPKEMTAMDSLRLAVPDISSPVIPDTVGTADSLAENIEIPDSAALAEKKIPSPEVINDTLTVEPLPAGEAAPAYQASLHVFAQGIFFAENKTVLLEQSYPELQRIAHVLTLYPGYQLRLTVQTRDDPDPERNYLLSVQRAKACLTYLAEIGVEEDRMFYQGFVINSKATPGEFGPGALFEIFPPGTLSQLSVPQPYSEPFEVATAEETALLALAATAVQFETASATLKPDSREVLDQIGDILLKNPDYRLSINGHTDSQGKAAFNQQLSEQRADACRQYLVKERNISPSRLVSAGFGETRPLGDNATPEGRRRNRRVEFKFFRQ